MTYYYFFPIFNSILYLFCDNLSVFRDHQSFKNKTKTTGPLPFSPSKGRIVQAICMKLWDVCTEEHGIGPLDPLNSVFLILSSSFHGISNFRQGPLKTEHMEYNF